MNIEQLKQNIDEVKKYLSLSINDPTNGNELVGILSELMTIQSLSADTIARAESFMNNEFAKVIESGKYSEVSATERKHLIQRDCGMYVELYNRAVNYNKEIHYKIESIRTLISNAKELLRQNL